jgi:hypothetical protein
MPGKIQPLTMYGLTPFGDKDILSVLGPATFPKVQPRHEEEMTAPREFGGSLIRVRYVLRDGDSEEEAPWSAYTRPRPAAAPRTWKSKPTLGTHVVFAMAR